MHASLSSFLSMPDRDSDSMDSFTSDESQAHTAYDRPSPSCDSDMVLEDDLSEDEDMPFAPVQLKRIASYSKAAAQYPLLITF